MHKVHVGSLKDLIKIHYKLTFQTTYALGYANTFQNQIAFKPIASGSVRDENINFESYRTILM